MSDVLLVLAIVAFFAAATLLLRVCRHVIAPALDDAAHDELSPGRSPERPA